MTEQTHFVRRVRVLTLSCAGVALAFVASIAVAVNTTVGNARVLVPNGTSLLQAAGGPDVSWFAVAIEPGKSYVIEALNPYDDLPSNTLTMNVFDASGVTTPPAEVTLDCTQAARAPSLQVASDGARCVVRALPPGPGAAQAKRAVYVAVTRGGAQQGFQVRARESTIYSRWTTNGYDFHVEVQNTTQDPQCVEATLYPDTGLAYAGTWSGAIMTLPQLLIPPFGATKQVVPSGTLVNGVRRGTMRLGACGAGNTNFMPDGINVSTFAYNTATGQYLFFFVKEANNGAAANSW